MRELKDGSTSEKILNTTKDITDQIKYLAERFNGMRFTLSTFCQLATTIKADAFDFCERAKAIQHGDYGKLLDDERVMPKHFDVEDAGLFADMVKEVAAKRSVENRMKACVEINDKIAEAIEGWQSKIDKMKLRTIAAGATQNEIDVANKKIVQFGEAIKILRKRGSQICEIYFNSKSQLTSFINEMGEQFKVINYNESV